MSQRDMQHQVAVDGGASTADGYSPASGAPPPATRLLDLPPALLDDIACWVMQLGVRSMLPLTCRSFSLAHLLHDPALRIQLGRQCCDQLLTPLFVAALQARKSKLTLTLWQPKTEDSECYTDLLAHTLPKLDNCAAVEVCRLVGFGSVNSDRRKELPCSPDLAQRLVDSFPNLTALVLSCHSVTCSGLASMLSHPQLSLQLHQLEIHSTNVKQPQQPGPGAVTLDPFQGARLKQLVFDGYRCHPSGSWPPLPKLQPLALHLTQLHLKYHLTGNEGPDVLVQFLQPLAQLQVLTLPGEYQLEGLTEVLQALPQLHTLQLPRSQIKDQQQFDTLLATTQITRLQLGCVEKLDTSCADAPCSWQRLELLGTIDWRAVAKLPLHSLSQPLMLGTLDISVEDISKPEVAAALHNLACACKVPVKIKSMRFYMLTGDEERSGVITSTLLEQQREDLAVLVAMLQPLRCYGAVAVYGLHQVSAADVLALSPLCRDCTHFELCCGSMTPSLEFWRQLVQLMPRVQEVTFTSMKESVSEAMHQSLQLMADQPWARWLDIIVWSGLFYTFEVQQAAHCLHTLIPSGAEPHQCLALTAAPAGCHAVDQVAAGLWWRAAGQQQSVQGPADSSAAVPCCLGPWGCCLADGATGSKGKMLQVGVGAVHKAGHVLVRADWPQLQPMEGKQVHPDNQQLLDKYAAQPSPAQPSPAQPSPAQPSPAQPSPAQPSPAQPSPAQPSPAQPSPAQPSPAQPSPAQPSPAQPSPAQPSPAQPSPAQPSPAQPSPAQPSPAQPSPAQPSPAQPSPAQPSPAQPSPAQPSPAQPSPAQPSPAQPSPAQPSPAQPSPAQPSPAQPSPAQPSPAQPSPAQPSPAPCPFPPPAPCLPSHPLHLHIMVEEARCRHPPNAKREVYLKANVPTTGSDDDTPAVQDTLIDFMN
ncbi:hypothetical protein QJQ45_009000 [Haematococcus lacustris]|nr:hypothetical protein QJQ45_009000 [Haematococcus lacustris]